MFLLSENYHRGRLVNRFRAYCKDNPFFDETYKKITAIPFHTIISVSRYPFLIQTFQRSNIPFQHCWFSKNFNKAKSDDEIPGEIETPTAELPLLYNLFGKLDLDESLLLTHNDLFEYLSKLLNENAIPTKLKELVKSSSQIIFLGFKFERWYVQLLLRLFELHDLNAQFERIALINDEEEDILDICETDFKINFINGNIDSFINNLYKKCLDGDLELRKATAANGAGTTLEEFKSLLRKNSFNEALRKLEEVEKTNSLADTVTQLSGNWSSIKDKQIKRTVPADALEVEINSFREQFLRAIENDFDQINQK